MVEVGLGWKRRKWSYWLVGSFVLQFFFVVSQCSFNFPLSRKPLESSNIEAPQSPLEVKLSVHHQEMVVDNGMVQITLSIPDGTVTRVQYNEIDNLLDTQNKEDHRGYWDIVWGKPGQISNTELIKGTSFKVIKADEYQIELSFLYSWNSSNYDSGIPINIDKRFVILRNTSGFYTYGIFERLEGWPDMNIDQTRVVFRLQNDYFHYMAISDDRQRIMPGPEDRIKGEPLEYPEAVLLTNPTNPALRGEVDDKYQYSCEDKENQVHGWISFDPPVGLWMITPSDEFRTAGPIKQDLTSHVGPITLSMFGSTHYAGLDLQTQFRNGEPWKKVLGPVFVYLNSVSKDENPLTLWEDAKQQMMFEVEKWPYDFPLSEDFPTSDQRGTVSGQLLVSDRYISTEYMAASYAYVGLALPGYTGSWQRETKGYQFWVQADKHGYFLIKDVRVGEYNLYAWVPGFIGDYKYEVNITITSGCEIRLGILLYKPPRYGPTLWEIGIPDRTAAEFYVPEANPKLMNRMYASNHRDKFRQYGLWERYTDLYRDQDLTYTVGSSNYQTDWFFAHVTRKIDDRNYKATTWQIIFPLENVNYTRIYRLQIALASAATAELQVRFNDPWRIQPHFTTMLIGRDNAIARHGIHGLYYLYSIDVPGSLLFNGNNNTISLTQSRSHGPFEGLMYDYIRLEGPPQSNSSTY